MEGPTGTAGRCLACDEEPLVTDLWCAGCAARFDGGRGPAWEVEDEDR